MKPTKEQEKEFWEWCGFTRNKQNIGRGSEYLWNYPDAQLGTLPSIDLNNLFKYAVLPLVDKKLGTYWKITAIWYESLMKHNEDPALALFWAIWKLIKEEEWKTK